MSVLSGKKILLGISGGIAAYKTPELVRRLKDQGADVRVVMTEGAKAFITPLTLQAVSANAVSDSLLDTQAELAMGHIELAKWADRVVIALIFIHNVVLSALNFLNLWPAIASNMIGVTFYFMAKYYEK